MRRADGCSFLKESILVIAVDVHGTVARIIFLFLILRGVIVIVVILLPESSIKPIVVIKLEERVLL